MNAFLEEIISVRPANAPVSPILEGGVVEPTSSMGVSQGIENFGPLGLQEVMNVIRSMKPPRFQ